MRLHGACTAFAALALRRAHGPSCASLERGGEEFSGSCSAGALPSYPPVGLDAREPVRQLDPNGQGALARLRRPVAPRSVSTLETHPAGTTFFQSRCPALARSETWSQPGTSSEPGVRRVAVSLPKLGLDWQVELRWYRTVSVLAVPRLELIPLRPPFAHDRCDAGFCKGVVQIEELPGV